MSGASTDPDPSPKIRPVPRKRRRRQKLPLQRPLFMQPVAWPKHPRRAQHHDLGRVQRWQSRCGFYRVDRYLDSSKRFLALRWKRSAGGWSWDLLGPHRTLAAAQRHCAQAAKGGA